MRNSLNLNWYDWSGQAQQQITIGVAINGNYYITNSINTATAKSVLVLNPVIDLSLPVYLANSSPGQFTMQF